MAEKKQSPRPKTADISTREERLAEALRANLKRRKGQARARESGTEAKGATGNREQAVKTRD
jgi:hypothetical protein